MHGIYSKSIQDVTGRVVSQVKKSNMIQTSNIVLFQGIFACATNNTATYCTLDVWVVTYMLLIEAFVTRIKMYSSQVIT